MPSHPSLCTQYTCVLLTHFTFCLVFCLPSPPSTWTRVAHPSGRHTAPLGGTVWLFQLTTARHTISARTNLCQSQPFHVFAAPCAPNPPPPVQHVLDSSDKFGLMRHSVAARLLHCQNGTCGDARFWRTRTIPPTTTFTPPRTPYRAVQFIAIASLIMPSSLLSPLFLVPNCGSFQRGATSRIH